ncbi:hypothetical protein NCCP1664_12910 [Zafaria cholistanensis]|uniref:DUF4242 domain-containing protein n=2 Tax=Zafaria cholistanensis TaxID=1682741 RepID=A0A5A7NPG7_9MICC|nr:hypothetical protein NCCP1664_12910 [Zafaria cholistanensis]
MKRWRVSGAHALRFIAVTAETGCVAPACRRPQNGGLFAVSGRIVGLRRRTYAEAVREGHEDFWEAAMPEFMDVHRGMVGITPEALHEAHNADLAIQEDEKVQFKKAWADPQSGVVFCLSEAPSADAVQRIHERTGHPADEIHPVPLAV